MFSQSFPSNSCFGDYKNDLLKMLIAPVHQIDRVLKLMVDLDNLIDEFLFYADTQSTVSLMHSPCLWFICSHEGNHAGHAG